MQLSGKDISNKLKKLIRILFKTISGLISLVFLALLLLFAYFNHNRDDIARNLLTYSNNITAGEIDFENISLSPFVHFPQFSISLNEVTYFASKLEERDTSEQAIITLDKIYLAFNFTNLFQGKLHITGVELENGLFQIVQHPDSSFNILNAMQIIDSIGNLKKMPKWERDKDSVKMDLELALDYLILDNIQLNYYDEITQSKTDILIDNIVTSFYFNEDTLSLKLKSNLFLNKVPVLDIIELNDRNLKIETVLMILLQDSTALVETASIEFDKAKLSAHGFFQFGQDKNLEIDLAVNDNDLSFTNLFLSQSGIENIQEGSVYFNGKITHDFINEIPLIDCKFGLKDIKITDPQSDQYLQNLNLTASFFSGKLENLSHARLDIDTLYAVAPAGNLNVSLKVKDFQKPKVETYVDINLDIENYDELLKFDFLEDIRGKIGLRFNYFGEMINDTTWTLPKNDSLKIAFNDVSFGIIDLLEVKLLDGTISGPYDSIQIQGLKLIAGNTDILINGDILHATSLLAEKEEITQTNLTIHSENFDLAELVGWMPKSRKDFGERFPYPIINADLGVHGTITREALLTAFKMPEMHFEIPYCNARIDSFLPPVRLSNGHLNFSEIDTTTVIDINGFDIEFDEGKLHGGCTYYNNTNFHDSVDIVVNIITLNPGYLLNYYAPDSVHITDSTEIHGKVFAQMKFSRFDTIRVIEHAFLNISDFEFGFPKDTIHCDGIAINIDDVIYDKMVEPVPFATLSADIDLEVERFWSSQIYFTELTTEIDIKEGVYTIDVLKSKTFLQNGEGKFAFAPYAETPYFNIDYSLTQFKFGNFFDRLHQPPVVKGNMDAIIQLKGKGQDWEEMSKTINGHILLEGQDITLHGINLDKILWKLNRSQNFTLLDIGAVVLAGPIGLLVTKGADVTSILINNKNDSTEISKLVSDWSIENGSLNMRDVAFATEKNRIAVRGKYDLHTDSIGIVLAVIDKKGKIKTYQSISGTGKNPKLSDIRPLKTLLKPVSNLLEGVLLIKGDTFYEGKVEHPVKKK